MRRFVHKSGGERKPVAAGARAGSRGRKPVVKERPANTQNTTALRRRLRRSRGRKPVVWERATNTPNPTTALRRRLRRSRGRKPVVWVLPREGVDRFGPRKTFFIHTVTSHRAFWYSPPECLPRAPITLLSTVTSRR